MLGTYYAAVIENRADFAGRVVVDVGAGSGILSLFAAQVMLFYESFLFLGWFCHSVFTFYFLSPTIQALLLYPCRQVRNMFMLSKHQKWLSMHVNLLQEIRHSVRE